MEEAPSAKPRPALLDLRGHFQLEPELAVPDSSTPFDSPMDVFPITDEQAILVRFQSTSLIDLARQEVHWTISCPAKEAALDVERNTLALGARGWIYLWDLRSGSLTGKFPLGRPPENIPTALAFHPQGLFLAVAPFHIYDVQLWRLSDGELVHLLCPPDEDYRAYKSLAFSPDGQFLVTGNFEAGEVWLWQVSDGQLVQQMEPARAGGRVDGLAFSPDGKLLVCSEGGLFEDTFEIRVWDMQTRQVTRGFSLKDWKMNLSHERQPTFSPDGKLLASTGITEVWLSDFAQRNKGSHITIWDVATRSELRQLSVHSERIHISRLKFSPSGRFLVSLGDQKPRLRWWDVETGREIYRMS